MSGGDKLLPSMEVGDVETTQLQKKLTDVRLELPAEDEKQNDSEAETETESETDSDSDSDAEYECSVCHLKFSGYIPLKQHEKGKKHAKMLSKKKMEHKLLKEGTGDEQAESGDEHLIPEPYAVCKMCDKEFLDPESHHKHLRGKTHRHKALEVHILEKVRENGEINEEKLKELCKNRKISDGDEEVTSIKDDDERVHDEFECKECEKVFSGLTPFSQHLMSKTHAKQIEKKKLLHKVIPETPEDVTSDKSEQGDFNSLSLEDDILICKACSTSFSGPENALTHLKSKNHSKNLKKYIRKIEKKKAKEEAKCSAKKAMKDPTEKQQVKKTKENEQNPDYDNSSKTDAPHSTSVEETENPATSSDKVEEGFGDFEKYKKYKELMDSLKPEDKILQ